MTTNNFKFHALRSRLKDLLHSWTKTTNDAAEPAALKPILVHGTGRSGTTLLMQLLGTSPQVIFDRTYPFEVRYLTYLLRWSLLLTQEWQPNDAWNPAENRKHPNIGGLIGPFPYRNAQFAKEMKGELWAKSFEVTWQEFSRTLSSKFMEDNKTRLYPKYYAEKVPLWVVEYLDQQPLSFHVIVLVRDPRDVFLSVNSFNDQRGFQGFGRLENDTDLDFAKRLTEWYRNIHKQKVMEAPNSRLVKYEQLTSDLAGEAQRLGQWLDTKFDPSRVKQQETRFKHHMTSASPEESVGRWRRELPDELNKFFIQELGEELRYFGYET